MDSVVSVTSAQRAMIDWSKVTLVYAAHDCVAPTDPHSTHAKAKLAFASALGVKVIAPAMVPTPGEG